MFQFYWDFEAARNEKRDVERARAFAPGLQTFDRWLEKNAGKIPLE